MKRTLKKFVKNPSAMIGIGLLLFFVVIAIIAPYIAPPVIPNDADLEKIDNLLNDYKEENKDMILYYFQSYYDTVYGFVEMDYESVKELGQAVEKYKDKEITKDDLIAVIQPLSEYYIIDYSYYQKLTDVDKLDGFLDVINQYKEGTVSEEEFEKELKPFAENGFVTYKYFKEFDKKPEKYIKRIESEVSKKDDLEKSILNSITDEVNSYDQRMILAGKYKEKMENLKVSSDFLNDAKSFYKEVHKTYINSINFDPYLMPNVNMTTQPQPPSEDHPFGVSNSKDIYYGVIWGTRTGFKIGLVVVSIATVIGLFIGSVSAYFGGWIDEIMMRITDIFMSIPFMLSAMVLTTILGTGLDKVMIAMVVFGWMGTARLIRGNILQAKNEQYVIAAKALGVADWKIIIKHILPNTIFPVVVQASMRIGSMVITAASLSFLGVGAPQGYADWGSILTYARDWMLGGGDNPFQFWYTIVYPGTAMVLFVLAWNLVGDALRDIFDPKLRM